MTATWMENTPRFSSGNLNHDWRLSYAKYTSAEDAVGEYLRLRCQMKGESAIDYEQITTADSSPSPENPASLQAHEAFFLEKLFSRTRGMVGPYKWRVWGVIRVRRATLGEAARLERRQRRRELDRIYTRERLKAWCAHYDKRLPDEAPWETLKDSPGISGKTAQRYRDEVDGALEEVLAAEKCLIRNSVRDHEDIENMGHAA